MKTARIWFMVKRLTEYDIEEAKDYLRLKWEREKSVDLHNIYPLDMRAKLA